MRRSSATWRRSFCRSYSGCIPERDLGGVVAGPDAWAVALSDASKRVMRTMEVTGRRVLAKWDERQEVVKELSDLDSTLRELKPLLARLAAERVDRRD